MKNLLYIAFLFLVTSCVSKKAIVSKLYVSDVNPQLEQVVYEGAKGFGKYTTGGYGGETYVVKNCEELNAVINKPEKRNIIMQGKFNNCGSLKIRQPNVTITTVGGAWFTGNGIVITAKNVIVHGIVVQVTDNGYHIDGENHADEDSILIAYPAENVIIDDVVAMWSIDENIGMYGAIKNITIQNSIIAEALHGSYHKDGSHSMGLLINEGGQDISILNNVFMHNYERNIRQGTGCSSEVRGNIFYGMQRLSEISPGGRFTQIDNYIPNKKGKILSGYTVSDVGSGVKVYATGNVNEYDLPELEKTITRLDTPEIHSGDPVISGKELFKKLKYDLQHTLMDKVKWALIKALIDGRGSIIDNQTQSVLYNKN